MNWIKQNWIKVVLGTLILGTGVFYLHNDYDNESALLSQNLTDKKVDDIDVSRYLQVMPIQPGTWWVYEGKRIFVEVNDTKAQETIAQKITEISDIKKEGNNLRVFTKTSYKNDPDFNEVEDSFLISESGYAFDESNLAYFPLVKGQRLTADYPERTDGYYDYYVTDVSVKNILGQQRKCYDISYYALPDESLETFCEGVGYVRDSYEHHGTPNEWDYKLIRIEYPALKK
ncbi:MAG: hypothetical protein A3J47_03790 [Candidatus Yanofskybacteria bacterium RIFCSPHIGHO2_02_FULL_43_22]|uniref:Uncharacterized protein n=1 Tax=Candidatus Yanofskybacteria bacterium RIFCSPHIGHO2_02_FULL_43_22 TaxID=1802681 RepID=A0A1F8FL30_9BACT|nr:MAG: hypothetical protein A3J47_03790 [Candidatus Yanofskybacteria bacterium RIFCSPHIGHO2_02_FULL_43_22]